MKILKIFEKDSNTWWGHAIASIAGSVIVAELLYIGLGIYFDIGLLFGSALFCGFYLYRELGDEMRHRYVLKDWHKPSDTDQVRPREDKHGDLLGPITWFVGCLVWFFYLMIR